ncbi:MAG: transcriptional regulator [Acidimicrobiaceae bacterium]|nr:transcriptional regulator [Acidimicrobiaceae bacterium]
MADQSPDPAADFDAQVTGIAALGEPLRRALYRYVVAQDGRVNRDQAAAGVGVARHVAKFHLDKLVQDGLLEVEYDRPSGRGGPGAGRPAKFYRRSARQLAVSLPPREYELAGRLLAQAIATSERDQTPIGVALDDSARNMGRVLGQRARRQAGAKPSRTRQMAAATSVLTEYGFEPHPVPGGMALANCPFHRLARDYTELICGMNLQLLAGIMESLQDPGLEARLEPAPGRCCVRLARSSSTGRDR